MQIASQTCSILVQVNNTNNISYGNNATNVHYNNFGASASSTAGPSGGSGSQRAWNGPSTSRAGASSSARDSSAADVEQSVVLIPSTSVGIRGSTKNLFTHYKHRLSVSGSCYGF